MLDEISLQALRTLFNISYQLNSVLGPTSWILVGLLSLMGGTFFYLDTVSCLLLGLVVNFFIFVAV
jgi:hypothetical protein